MTTTQKTTQPGFIATDGDSSLIHGIGVTAKEAREDAERELIQAGFEILDAWSEVVEDFPGHYIVRSDIIAYPATQALLDTVGMNGGSGPYAWEVVDGVARLADEEEEV
jgi:hypothetical protein